MASFMPDYEKMAVAKEIEELWEKSGRNQSEVARLTGIKQNTISIILQTWTQVGPINARKLLDFLGPQASIEKLMKKHNVAKGDKPTDVRVDISPVANNKRWLDTTKRMMDTYWRDSKGTVTVEELTRMGDQVDVLARQVRSSVKPVKEPSTLRTAGQPEAEDSPTSVVTNFNKKTAEILKKRR